MRKKVHQPIRDFDKILEDRKQEEGVTTKVQNKGSCRFEYWHREKIPKRAVSPYRMSERFSSLRNQVE